MDKKLAIGTLMHQPITENNPTHLQQQLRTVILGSLCNKYNISLNWIISINIVMLDTIGDNFKLSIDKDDEDMQVVSLFLADRTVIFL